MRKLAFSKPYGDWVFRGRAPRGEDAGMENRFKTCTTRLETDLAPGDEFSVDDPMGIFPARIYRVREVRTAPVAEICDGLYAEEAFDSAERMWEALRAIYPGITPRTEAHAIRFEYVGEFP